MTPGAVNQDPVFMTKWFSGRLKPKSLTPTKYMYFYLEWWVSRKVLNNFQCWVLLLILVTAGPRPAVLARVTVGVSCFIFSSFPSFLIFCPVDLSILINWMHPFPLLGVSGVIFNVFGIEIPVSKQVRPWSDATFCGIWYLGLHCLPRSQKWDAYWGMNG